MELHRVAASRWLHPAGNPRRHGPNDWVEKC
jgi:hypothetical protein